MECMLRLVLRDIDQLTHKGALNKGASLKSKGNLIIDLTRRR